MDAWSGSGQPLAAWLASACGFDHRGLWTAPVADPYGDALAPGTDGGLDGATIGVDGARVGDSVGIVQLEAGLIAQDDDAQDDDQDDEVVICHLYSTKPRQSHTIEVSPSAVATHLGHGDTIGPCAQ